MAKRRAKKRRVVDAGKHGWTPHYLTTATYVATATLVVCLFAGAGLVDRYIKEGGSRYVAAVISALLVDYANHDRADAQLNDLRINPKLVEAAQLKANDMAAKGYFSHTSPEGYDSWHWFREVGYDYAYAGENLAVDFSESADVEKAWMNSPTHRDNILNGNYTEIGIATAKGMYKGHETVFAVQMFGRPSAQEVARAVEAPPSSSEVKPRTEIASSSQVLGAISGDPIREPQEVSNGVGAALMTPEQVPWWARLAVQPKQTLRYAYYIIGLVILLALFGDMEIEIKRHHIKHAMKAGVMLGIMSMLFIVADWAFFAQPILAAVGKLVGN